MQGPVPLHHRKFFRRSHTPSHPAYGASSRPTSSRAAGGPRRRGADVPGPDRRRGTGGAETVNSPTSSSTAPAATPRTGRRESALPPPGAKTQSLPFAAIPHHIAADPRLSPTDLRVLAALLY